MVVLKIGDFVFIQKNIYKILTTSGLPITCEFVGCTDDNNTSIIITI